MFIAPFEEIFIIYGSGLVDKRPILLDVEKVVYYAPYITVDENQQKVIDYTKASLINGETINLAIKFEELVKQFSF